MQSRKSWSSFLLLPLLALACAGDPDPGEDVVYSQLVDGYATIEECLEDLATHGVGNCARRLTLCANGGLTLLVTDIVNEGRYTRDGDVVHGSILGTGDAPETFTVTITAGGLESDDLAGEHPWETRVLDAAARREVAEECALVATRSWW